MRLSNHVKRIISSIIGAPLLILFILKANTPLFSILIIVCILFGLREFYIILEHQQISCFKNLGLFLGILLALLFSFCIIDPMIICFGITASIIIIFLRALFSHINLKNLNISISGTLLGIIYIPLALSHFILINKMDNGGKLILFLLFIIWACDIGAYYFGTYLGKHLLCPNISPKKTIEGSIGGIISSIIVAQLIRPFWWPSLSYLSCLVLSFCISVVAECSDLSESILKRSAGVKDSGSIIPGHGGLLDRIDSLLFAAPMFYYFMRILNV